MRIKDSRELVKIDISESLYWSATKTQRKILEKKCREFITNINEMVDAR
jgi:hypothetical protein